MSYQIVSRYSSKILYDSKDYFDFKGQSWNDFVLFLLKKNANFSDANLSGANLYNANLYNTNLIDANLSGANLIDANLIDANLRNANLRNANLSEANLSGANLRNASLRNANLSGANFSCAKNIPIFCKWDFSYSIKKENDVKVVYITIGCESKSIKEWDKFFRKDCKEKLATDRNSVEFQKIKAMYKSYKVFIKEMGPNLLGMED